MVKVSSLSQGYTDAQIIQALGTRADTSMQGLHKLRSNTAAQPQTKVNPLAKLEDMFALTCAEPEQESAAAPLPVPASAPAPSHDSAACHKQVETAVKRMWDMVADNEEMQQHLVSHQNRTAGTLAGIQASHKNGSAHPMARLSKVQDPGATLWSEKRSWGCKQMIQEECNFGCSLPKVKAQQAAAEPGQSAEPDAEPFSKPKPARP